MSEAVAVIEKWMSVKLTFTFLKVWNALYFILCDR